MIEPKYLLDTNICIYLLEGRSDVARERLGDCHVGEVVMSSIVCAEILIGAQALGQIDKVEAFIERFPVANFDRTAAQSYAGLPFQRGNFDRLIAAHVLSLDLTLVTNNEADFADVPGLKVENWAV
jgi:tRNA(fMet)-specific endonuclease VapC